MGISGSCEIQIKNRSACRPVFVYFVSFVVGIVTVPGSFNKPSFSAFFFSELVMLNTVVALVKY